MGFLQEDNLIIRKHVPVLSLIAANSQKAACMLQPRDLAALNSLRCFLVVLLSEPSRGLLSCDCCSGLDD